MRVIQKWYSFSNQAVVQSTLPFSKSVLVLELGDALYAIL